MGEPLIARVKDNKDKQRTYAYWKSRYKLAMSNGFYVEALMIDYALIEDRLASTLYHSGVMPNREALKMNATSTKAYLKQILKNSDLYKYKGELRVNLKNISGKINCLRSIILWAKKPLASDESSRYLKALKAQYEMLDLDEFAEFLDKIEAWCKYRNEIIHAAMNKSLDDLQEKLAFKAEEGLQLANYLDAKERSIKKGNKIRRAANLHL